MADNQYVGYHVLTCGWSDAIVSDLDAFGPLDEAFSHIVLQLQ